MTNADPMSDLLALKRVRALVKSGNARALRVSAGLGLTEMARAAGVAPRSLYRWEHGKQTPSGPAALRYGRVLQRLMQESP